MGCTGRATTPRAAMERRARGDGELRRDGVRSGRADREWVLALGGVQHPGVGDYAAGPAPARPRRCQAAARAGEHGSRDARLPRAVPAPGGRTHRYLFTVHALKTDKIEVPANATAALVGFNLHANELAKATFTAKYHR